MTFFTLALPPKASFSKAIYWTSTEAFRGPLCRSQLALHVGTGPAKQHTQLTETQTHSKEEQESTCYVSWGLDRWLGGEVLAAQV